MPGGFRAVSTARTEVVVPLASLEHHMSHCRMPTNKFGDPEVVERRGSSRSIANGSPVNQGNASAGSRLRQERYSWIRGEFRVKMTRPWGSVVNLVPLGREHHQDSPAKGPTGRLGID